jgi:inner membrane transporter RhtA
MNACFYSAIDHLPLGTVAAIEFLPVIVLAAAGARTSRNAAALAAAVSGVYLLTDLQLRAQPVGLAFAFANAALFALYIVLADRMAKRAAGGGIDALAGAMLVAGLVITPIGGAQALPAFADPALHLAGIGVGVASSVIPYITDQLALARLPRATYALMVALLPATATVIGIAVLAQVPTPGEATGVALVVAGRGHPPGSVRRFHSSLGGKAPGCPESCPSLRLHGRPAAPFRIRCPIRSRRIPVRRRPSRGRTRRPSPIPSDVRPEP